MTERIPAEVFPPGEFLRDELDARDWTQAEFAEIIGRPVRLVNEVISGKKSITPETARDFGAALGTSAELWLNLEASYRLSRVAPAAASIAKSARLRELFPVREMMKRNWIEPSENSDVVEKRVLDFFNIDSIDEEVRFSHAARRNHAEQISLIQLAWLFRVRQIATTLEVPAYSKRKLRSALTKLEVLMQSAEDIRHVPSILADSGVRFVIVEPVPGSKIEGVCFWIKGNKVPVIGLSLRYDRIDNFWFNLRHEIEHVLNEDGKNNPIIDETDALSGSLDEVRAERQANKAAGEFCVPAEKMDEFIDHFGPIYSTKRVLEFSHLIGRHPGIVVGQLQKKTGQWRLFRKFQVKIRHIITETSSTEGYGHTVSINI